MNVRRFKEGWTPLLGSASSMLASFQAREGFRLSTIELYCMHNSVLFTIHSSKEAQIHFAAETANWLYGRDIDHKTRSVFGYGRKREIDESA
jgi:hypothetical protein